MKKNNIDIEEELLQALSAYNQAKEDYDTAVNVAYTAEMAFQADRRAYNQAFYGYVRELGQEALKRENAAREKYHRSLNWANQADFNKHLALCKFKKAAKLYKKLQRKAEKQHSKKQPGGEE